MNLKMLPPLLSLAAFALTPLTSEACNIFYVPDGVNPITSATSAPGPLATPEAGTPFSPSGLQHLPNRGFYNYDASTGKYHLTYAMYDSAVTNESLIAGDIWATDSGSSSASPSFSSTGPGVTPAEECGGYDYDITTLQSITVTAFAPPTGGANGTYFERIIEPTGWGGGGGGAIDRKTNPTPHVQNITDTSHNCSSPVNQRHAVAAEEAQFLNLVLGDFVVVTLGSGDKETWPVYDPGLVSPSPLQSTCDSA